MGGALVTPCCQNGAGEEVTLSPTPRPETVQPIYRFDQMLKTYEAEEPRAEVPTFALPMQKAVIEPREDPFDGVWVRGVDKFPMGTIQNRSVIWDAGYNHDKSPIQLRSDGTLSFEVRGVAYTGRFCTSPQETIQWSDGEIWKRVQK